MPESPATPAPIAPVLPSGDSETGESVEAQIFNHVVGAAVTALGDYTRHQNDIESKRLDGTRLMVEARPAERMHEQTMAGLANKHHLDALQTAETTKRATLYVGGALLAVVLGILAYALYLGRNELVADIVKIALGMVAGGFGGYGIGVQRRIGGSGG